MNISARRIFSVILVFVLLIAMTGNCLYNIVGATSTNLLLNSGFEEFSDNQFTNWQLWPGNNGNTKLEQVDGRNGKAAKITVDNNNNTVNLYQTITLNSAYSYTFTAWIKTENIALQWDGANGVFLNLSYNNNLALVKSELIKTDTDWKKVEFVVDASLLQGDEWGIHFDIAAEFLTGCIYVDDVCLERIDESDDTDTSDSEELLKNNGFEEYSDSGFTDWTLWPGNHGRTTITQVDGRNGKAAEITVKDHSSIVNLYQNIVLDSTCEYVFTAWVKIENIVRQWDNAPGVSINFRCDNIVTVASESINTDTDWQKIELEVDASVLEGDETDIRFDIALEYIKGTVYIDDASLKVKTESDSPENPEPEPTPNPDGGGEDDNIGDEENQDTDELLKNNGFETFSGGNFTDWNLWKGNNGNTKLEQADGHTEKAAKITIDNNNNTVNLYQSVTLNPEKKYILTAWIKTENIALQWDGANGVYLCLSYNNNIPLVKSELIKTDCDWQKLELIVDASVLTGDEWSVNFDIAAEYLTGAIYVDDVSLKIKEDTSSPDDTEDNDNTEDKEDAEENENKDPSSTPDNENDTSGGILKNSGFETFSGGNFTNWNLWKGNQGNTKLKQVKGRTGKAAKIIVDNNNNTVNLYQSVTLNPEKKYILTAWIKTENIKLQWDGANGVYLCLSYNNNIPLVKSESIKTDCDWQKLELIVDASVLTGDEWSVNFDIAAEYLTGNIYIDDVNLEVTNKNVSDENTEDTENTENTEDKKPSSTPDNESENSGGILKNSGFETFSGGNFTNWNLWKGNQGNTKLKQVKGRTGKAAKIIVDNNNNTVNLYQSVTLNPEKKYILTAWIKTENIKLQWDGANGVYLCLSYNNNIPLVKSESIKTDCDWQKLELVVDASVLTGDEWSVNFDIAAEYLTGNIYIDDVSLEVTNKNVSDENTGDTENTEDKKPSSTPDNESENSDKLLKNSGFETFSGGNFTNWNLWKGNQGNTTLKQVKGRTGKAAKIMVDNDNNTVNLYQSVTLNPEKKYILTAWIKTENIKLQWDGANGVYLCLSYNNNIPLVKSEPIKTDCDWQKLELIVDASMLTGDEWSVNFDIAAEYLTGNIYIDDVNLEVTNKNVSGENANPEINSQSESGLLLKNKGFENYSNGSFTDWTLWPGNKGNTTLEQVKGRTGKAAKITVDNDQNIVNLYQEITLDPSCEYTFSVWVKTKNIALQWPGAQGVYLNLSCNNGKILMSESVNSDSDWQKLEVVVNGGVLTGEEWSVRFDIAAEYLTGELYIDDAEIKVTGKATAIAQPDDDELLKNNSFEIYSAGNFANWTVWKGNKGNTKVEQVDGRTGKAAKITVDNNNNIVNLYQEIELDPSCEYTFSVWVKTENINLQWAGAQGVYLNFKYNNNVVLMSKPVTTDSGWQKLELVVNGGILKGDEWGVSLDIAAEFLTGVIYIDDASVKVTGKGTPVPEQSPDELLENNSFELYSGYNFARWNLNRGNNGNTLLEQVDGRTGKAAKITVDDNNNIVALYQNITLDPSCEYTFSVWIKTEDIALQWEGAEGIYLAFGYNNTTPIRSKAIKTDSGWQKLEIVVGGGDLKGDEWGVMFTITAEFLTGTIYIDDASMKVTGKYQPKATSFLQNGSFDTPDDDTIIKDWTAFAEDIYSVLERNTDKTKDGIASASIFNADENTVSFWEQRLDDLDTTKEYLISGYIFSDMIVSDSNGAAVFVEFYDPEGNLIKTLRSDYVTGEQTDWTYFENKLTFPENCFTMVVKAGLINAVGTAYFDGFTLTEYDEKSTTSQEGVFENIYALKLAEDEIVSVDIEGKGNNFVVWLIVAIGVSVVIIGTAITLFISKKRKKNRIEGGNNIQ